MTEKKDVTISLGGSTVLFLIAIVLALSFAYYLKTENDAAVARLNDSFQRDIDRRERLYRF